MNNQRKKIIVLGGYGTVGSRICDEIARIPYVECVIAGPNLKRAQRLAREVSASTLKIDIEDEAAVQRELAGAFMVINTAGPFQVQSPLVAQFCANSGINYIDTADDRHFVNEVLRLNATAKRNDCLLVSGAASVPALASILVDSLDRYFDKIDEIHVYLATGNQAPVGRAGACSLLLKIGSQVRTKLRGRWQEFYCWTGSRRQRFPDPFGRQRSYLYDVPLVDQFFRRYGAREGDFHFGLELPVLNHGLWLLGWFHRRGVLKQPARYTRLLFAVSRWFRRLGNPAYMVRVQVTGMLEGKDVVHTVSLLEPDSERMGIVTGLPITLARHWIDRGIADSGAISAIGVTDLESLKPELIRHDVKLILD